MSQYDSNRPAEQDAELSSAELEQAAGGVDAISTSMIGNPSSTFPIKPIGTSPTPLPDPVTTSPVTTGPVTTGPANI